MANGLFFQDAPHGRERRAAAGLIFFVTESCRRSPRKKALIPIAVQGEKKRKETRRPSFCLRAPRQPIRTLLKAVALQGKGIE